MPLEISRKCGTLLRMGSDRGACGRPHRSCAKSAIVLVAVVATVLATPAIARAHGGGKFDAPPSTAPTIDGAVNASEWSDAAAYALAFPTGSGSLPATVRFKEDRTNLYVAMSVQDPAPGPNPSLSIDFDNTHNGSLDLGDDTWIDFVSGGGSDFFYNPNGSGGASRYNDFTDNGSNDTTAAATSSAGNVSFEFKHPLCSSDTAHDICWTAGQILGINFQYEPDTAPGVFYDAPGPSFSDPSNNWADLVVGADTTSPTVAITQPDPNDILRGTVKVAATASDNVGVTRVDFTFFGRQTPGGPLVEVPLGSDTTAPYSVSFDTTTVPNTLIKDAIIKATAYDAANNSASVQNAATVDNAGSGQIVFESDRDGNSEIWSMYPDGSHLKQLTFTDPPTVNTRPSVSPDGHTIVFERTINGDTQIYSMHYDGTNEQQLTTNAEGNNGAPAFSPDGTKIAFDSDRATGLRQIYTMNADGSNQTRITNDNAIDEDPSWNNDGTRLAIASNRSETFDIWTVSSTDGSSPFHVTASNLSQDSDPDWSPDGQTILFVSNQSGATSVWKVNADGTTPENLTNASIYDADVAWAPDGNHLAFVRDSGGQDFHVWTARPEIQGSFGNAQLQITSDPCIGYTISDVASKSYSIQSPPSSNNCVITQDHSISGDTPSTIDFNNVSGRTVDVYWLDYDGNRVHYNTLANGQGYTQETWITHPWVIVGHGPWRNSFPDWAPLPAPARATNLSLTPSTTSAAAGAPRVKLGDVPPSVLLAPQSTAQSAPVNETPINETPVNELPVNELPVNELPVNELGFDTLSASVPALGNVTLDSIPLLRTGGWPAALTGTPLAGLPLQNVTLRDYYALPADVNPETRTSPAPIPPITLGELDLSRSPLGSLPADAIVLANVQLSWLRSLSAWCDLFGPVYCQSGATALTDETVMAAALQGAPVNETPVNETPVNETPINEIPVNEVPVNETPVNEIPVNELPVNETPVNELPINETPVNELPVNEILLTAPVNELPVNELPVNELPVNEIMAHNATVTNSPVNEIPVNELATPGAIVDCTAIDCATATLGQAYAAGALQPNTTLADLIRAAGPEPNALDGITFGDLKYYDGVTLRSLIASYPDGTFTLGDYLLLVLRSPTASQGLAWERLNIFGSAIQQYSTGGSTVGYRAQFDVQPNGSSTGFPSPVTVNATLGRGFFYVPGSSTLVSSATSCSSDSPAIADPKQTTLNDGGLKLTWTVDTTVGKGYAICFTTRPGIELGPQGASLDATPSGGQTASATGTALDVGDTLESNNDASTAPEVFNDSFYLSYLTSASDVDYYRFAAPPIGTVVTVHLSHLPTDYDLVVYGPPETQLRPSLSSSVPLDEPPLTDSGYDLTHATDTLPSQTLDDLRLQSLPMVGVSASRGTDPEDIVFVSQGGTGYYTIQVTGYNGATSAKPYMLRVQTQAPRQTSNVAPRTISGTAGPALPNLPTGLNTVFVVDRKQLEGIYGSAGASSVMSALSNDSALFTSLGYPNVTLSVDNPTNDSSGAVAAAYAAWNANPGDPAAANGVVQAINTMIDSKIRSQPNGAGVKYLVIVGGDQVIPFARLDDFTVAAGNETGYAANFPSTSDLFSALNAGQMLSDDPYGDTNPVPYLTRQLYIPELAVGRLVETPADIVRTLNNFVSTAVGGHLDPSSSLTTGYDFLNDGAQQVNGAFSRFGTSAQTLFDDPAVTTDGWTLSDLLGKFLPTGGSAPSITSLNGHASHYQFAPAIRPSGSPLFTTTDLTGSSASTANKLVFSMGCHAGLSVADSIVTASNLDWPEAFAQKSAGAFLGNTGFGFGDSLVVAYSEEVDKLFAQRIAAGSSVGDALAAAKQAYYGELGVFGVYDEKAMAEFTLYGLPMWKVTAPATTGAAGVQAFAAADSTTTSQTLSSSATSTTTTSAKTQSLVTDPVTGLDTETFSVNPQNTRDDTGQGTFWSGPDGVQVEHLRPIQPKAFVSLGGTTGHGALITELTSGDTNCINPVYARPVLDLTGTEPEVPFGDVAFPSKLQALRTFLTPSGLQQRLVLITGQFFTHTCSTSTDPQVGVQRLYGHIAGRVYRSTSTDYVPPAYQLIQSTAVNGNAAFTVDVTDTTPSTDAVKQVVVAVRSGTQTQWTFVSLTQSTTVAARWTGGAPVSDVSNYEYFVQAVDKNGNVAVSTNKGFYFAGEIVQPPTGTLQASLTGTKTNGWFTSSPVGVTATEAAGVTLQASVDGGPFGAVPSSISGDGVHRIDFRASNGDTGTLIAPIDTKAPTITINTPVSGAQYVTGSSVKADYFCSDSGSGIASGCVGTVPNGAAIDTSCATTTCTKTFTVSAATDVAGHTTAAKSVSYTVVPRRKILFSSDRTTSGDIYAMNPDGTGVVQLTSTAGVDEQPAWSPDGSHIAFSSARNSATGGGLDIYVMDANGANVRRLTTAVGDDTAPAWSPDGNKIAFQSKRNGNTPEIYVMNTDGTNQTRLTNNAAQDIEPSWSPDGTKLAFASDRNIGMNVWVMNADGSGLVQLTSTKQAETDPAWSPTDANKIALASNRAGSSGFDLYTIDPNNPATSLVQLTSVSGDDTEPTWSRDGARLAFSGTRSTNKPEIYVMDATKTTSVTRLTTYSGIDRNPDW
jgi:Tol biopolymer transport system component